MAFLTDIPSAWETDLHAREAEQSGEFVSPYLTRELRQLRRVRAARILRRIVALSRKYAEQGNRARCRYWWRWAERVAGQCGGISGVNWSGDHTCIVLDGDPASVWWSPLPMRFDTDAASRLIAQAHASLYYADAASGSMLARHHIEQASYALEDAARSLPDDLAEQAIALAAQCDAALETSGFPFASDLEAAASQLRAAAEVVGRTE